MKAQVLHNIADIRYEEHAMPELKEGWVLVKVKAVGVCGSDIPRIYKTGAHKHPIIPGHEFTGQVADVSDAVSKDWIGKRVGVFPLIPCGECECCRNRQYEMCSNYNYLGSRCDGGLAEYVAVPEWNLIELPDNVTYRQAAMMEPMSVAVHAIRQFGELMECIENGKTNNIYRTGVCNRNTDKCNSDNSDVYNNADKCNISVCVIGLGTIGLLLTMFLLDAGIKNVSVICNKQAQSRQARLLNIPDDNIIINYTDGDYTEDGNICDDINNVNNIEIGNVCNKINNANNANDRSLCSKDIDVTGRYNKKYDYIFECVGREETICEAIELAAPAAHIVLVGNPYSDMDIPKDTYWKILRNQIKISGTWNSSYRNDEADDWHYVLERLASGDIHPERLITHEYPLSDIQQGMRIMRDKTEDYVKVMCVLDL